MSQAGAGNSGRLTIRVQIEGIAEAEAKLKSLSSTIDSIGTKISGTASSISKLPTSLNSLKSASDSTATSLQKLPTAINAINTSTQTGIRGIDSLKTSVTGLTGTLNTAAGNVQQFSSRVQQSMQSISTGGGLQNVQTAVTGLNTTFNAGIPTIQRYGTTLTSMGTSAASSTGGITSLNTALGGVSASANSATTSVGRSVQEWTTLGSRIGGVALSTVIMTSAIDEAIGMQDALNLANKKVSDSQAAYNQAVKDFGPNSNEAERAMARLEKAQNAQTFAARNSGFAWRDIIPIAGLMATQAIEPLIKGFSKLNELMKAGTLMSTFSGALGGIKGGLGGAAGGLGGLLAELGGVSGAFQKGTPAVTGFTGALGSMNKAAGVGTTTLTSFGGVVGGLAPLFAIALASINTFLLAMKDIEMISAAASGKMVEAAQKAKEAWDLSKWSGMADVLGKVFGVEPAMDKTIARVKEVETGVKLARGEYERLGDTVFVTTGRLGESAQGAQLAKGQYEDLGKGVLLIKGGMESLTNATEDGRTAEEQLSVAQIQLQKDTLELEKGIMDGLLPSFVQTVNEGQNLSDTVTNKLTPAMQNMVSPTADVAKSQTMIREEIESGRSTIGDYVTNIEGVTEKSNEWAEANETLKTKLGDTNDALIEHINQMNELVGTEENATNAILEIAGSLAEHRVNIDQLTESLNTQEGQLLSYQNAVAAGDEAFLSWIQSSRDASVEAETFKGNLQGMADLFGGLPGFMEGTVEEYQAFILANTQGGEAVEQFMDMVLESWRGLVSAAEPLFNDLKSAWQGVFSGETLRTAQDAIAAANAQIAQNVADNNEAIVNSAEGVAPKIKDIFEGVDWESIADAMADPFAAAFDKLPPAVSATLDETERSALVFQAKFAEVATMAGMTFGQNLQANMSSGFETAITAANSAVLEMLAPFAAEHPEIRAMFDELQLAMQQTGPGAAQAVQGILEKFSGMQGPVGELAGQMLTVYQENFADKLPGVTKGGVEGAMEGIKSSVDVLSMNLETLFGNLIDAINGDLNSIKQTNVPEISANPRQAQVAASIAQQSIDLIKQSRAPDIDANGQPAQNKVNTTQQQIDNIRQSLAPQIDVDTSMASQKLTLLKGQIDSISQGMMYLSPGAQGSYGGNTFGQPWNPAAAGGGYNPFQPGMFGAEGIGPQWISKPTMMIVGEGGEPEFVSVIPKHKLGNRTGGGLIQAQGGFGQQSIIGQNYGYGGQGLWQTDAEEEAYKREVQAAMQQGTQQGMEQSYDGMQNAVQQGAMEGTQQGMEQGMGDMGGGGGGGAPQGYPIAPSNTELWGAGRFNWTGGAMGSQLGGMGGGGAQYPVAPSNTEIFGAGRFTWTGGGQGTNLGMAGMMGGSMYPQIQYGEAQAEAISQGFQQGMNNQQQIWVNQGLKAGQSMGTGTLMGYQQFMNSQQGQFNQIVPQIFRGFPAGAATFGGLMGEAMMERFNRELQDTIAKGPPEIFDQWGRRLDTMAGTGGAATGPRNVQPSSVPAYTGSLIPKGVTPSQTINGVKATILPGQYIGSGQWPPATGGTGGGGGAGGGGGGLPPPSGGGGSGGGMGGGQQPGYPVAPSNTEIWGQMPITYKWYGPGDARNTVSAGGGGSGAIPGGGGGGGVVGGGGLSAPPMIGAQGGFHGVVDRAMTLAVHPNERVDVSPGPRGGGGHGEGCQHIHIYIGNEKIKELVRNNAGTQMDRFIR